MKSPSSPPRYRGKVINVHIDKFQFPDGSEAEMEVVRHPGGAAVVALDENHNVCLLRQYRHVLGAWIWELPAGKRDAGEDPLITAQRELEEEAGLRAAQWLPLGAMWTSPGILDEVLHLYLARDLTRVPANTEAHELIEVHWLAWDRALAMARGGEIADAKTAVGLLWASGVL